jgi:cathepsin A (carboxypeptidase C)
MGILLSVLNGVLAFLLSGAAFSLSQLSLGSISDQGNATQIWRESFLKNHYIEVKECGLCEGADLWSGYYHSIQENISIFFVYARASESPETSPLALWTNGGPGTSGLGVAFSTAATGCTLQDDARGMKLVYDSKIKRWNEKVNMIFLDQPIGTGFSRGNGRGGEDTRIGAEYIYNFIQVVLSRHPSIPEISLHSLSYGGHFIPEWANKIVTENTRVKDGISNHHVIPLTSVTMGNAWFAAEEQYLERFDSLCEIHPYIAGSTGPLLSSLECQRAAVHRATCADLLRECGKSSAAAMCAGAHMWCLTATSYYIGQSGRSMYDLSTYSENPDAYDRYPALNRYLNQRAVQVALGVIKPEDKHPVEWLFYNTRVSALHTLAGDHVRRTDNLLPAILAAGVNILLYQGTPDFIVGYRGVRRMIESLKLVQGQVSDELKVWKNGPGRYLCSTNTKINGAGRFCYIEIDGVGHGVAYDYEGWAQVFENWILEGLV